MSEIQCKTLKEVIKERNLLYKQLAALAGLDVTRVCADSRASKLSAERALLYARALGIQPAVFRRDIFGDCEVIYK